MASAKNSTPWTSVSINPMIGILDVRSRPAAVPNGGYRWRLNIAASDTGKACLRDGFSKFLNQPNFVNCDHHHQGATREAITLGFESTSPLGVRRLFDATQSRVSLLNEDACTWTDIVTGKGAPGSRFKAAELQDWVLFTNDTDEPFLYTLSSGVVIDPIPGLSNAPWRDSTGTSIPGKHLTKAKVTIQYQGVLFLMNVFQDGTRFSSRITWSDLNDPTSWVLNPASSIAGFQDLDYGSDILAAAEMNGVLYVYTTKAIWKIAANSNTSLTASPFVFQKVYSEPKNETGCLTFPNTLVSTGNDHYYMGRDGIYHFNQYLSAPEWLDWVHRADGVIFTKLDTRLSLIYCDSPVAEFYAVKREIWFSWSSAGALDNNNLSLVLNVDQKCADVVDAGFTAFVNFRPDDNSVVGSCNEVQNFLGVSGVDWSWKSIGNGVFSREFSSLVDNDRTNDLPLDNTANYFLMGYNRILRGTIPLGLEDREKLVRKISLTLEATQQDVPCLVKMRIGNSLNLVDSNSIGAECSVQWRSLTPLELKCLEPQTIAALTAKNQRPSVPFEFPSWEQGVYLYWELSVTNSDGSPAIGGEACFSDVSFDSMSLPKP